MSVPILDDDVLEGNETFFAELDNQGQPAFLDPDRRIATIVILEDTDDSKTNLCTVQ